MKTLEDIERAFAQWRAERGIAPVSKGPWYGRRATYLLYGTVPHPGTVVGVEPHRHAVYLWLDEPLMKPVDDMNADTRADPELLPVLLVNIYDDETFRWEA